MGFRERTWQWAVVSVMVALPLASCTQQVKLSGADRKLTNVSVTLAKGVIEYPDDNPSIPDGKVVWERMNCAECHGTDGKGIAGKCQRDLTDNKTMRNKIPTDEYLLLNYGIKRRNYVHPVLQKKLTTRQIWDLIFYVHSLYAAPLTDAQIATIDPVFGSNCAVCHGKRGYGDGPLSHNLEPLPADFHQFNRFFDRQDDMLYNHISDGIFPTAMPAFLNRKAQQGKVKFDPSYINQLVQYVRHFHVSNQPNASAQ